MTGQTRNLYDFYTRNASGQLRLNVPSVLFGGYDPVETNRVVEEINSYYRDMIVDLIEQIAQKDKELARLKGN